MKIAIPIENGMMCSHFGHAAQFAIIDVENGNIAKTQLLVPPPHEPGSLPQWLHELGTTHLICGGIGGRAVELIAAAGVQVIAGVTNMDPARLMEDLLANRLKGITGSTCPGHGEEGHQCQH
ncbi:MAG: NifB/NifX family molybdenum-iron cluster-binding protein [Deltaproteobacteria bacterium]|nr:NifB/NifX family molybdenum-iron cluster-binding protein [Deltaproteobacteria bacterium]MDL1960338.1 NifB/NifX family molybdenum-iron cluster-binding protein [Deltaproteobacteria bacterium]